MDIVETSDDEGQDERISQVLRFLLERLRRRGNSVNFGSGVRRGLHHAIGLRLNGIESTEESSDVLNHSDEENSEDDDDEIFGNSDFTEDVMCNGRLSNVSRNRKNSNICSLVDDVDFVAAILAQSGRGGVIETTDTSYSGLGAHNSLNNDCDNSGDSLKSSMPDGSVNRQKKKDYDFNISPKAMSSNGLRRDEWLPLVRALWQRESNLRSMSRPGFQQTDRARILGSMVPDKLVTYLPEIGQRHRIFCGRFSTDGKFYLTAAQDQQIRIFDVHAGFKLAQRIHARDIGWSIIDTDYSPDGRWVLYSSWSRTIKLVNIECKSKITSSRGNHFHEELDLDPPFSQFCPFSISWSHNSSEILCGCNDKSIYLYDMESRKRTLRVQGHLDDVNAVAFADMSSQILFSGSDDCTVRVWDCRLLNPSVPRSVGQFIGHMEGITCISSKEDGRYIISNSKDQSIKLWDIRRMTGQSDDHEADRAAQFALTQSRGHRQGWDYRISGQLHSGRRLRDDSSIMTYTGHSVLQTLIRCYFSPPSTGQQFIYSGSHCGSVYIYDVLTGRIMKRLCGHDMVVRDVSWHPDVPVIMTASWDGRVGMFSHHDGDDDTLNTACGLASMKHSSNTNDPS